MHCCCKWPNSTNENIEVENGLSITLFKKIETKAIFKRSKIIFDIFENKPSEYEILIDSIRSDKRNYQR